MITEITKEQQDKIQEYLTLGQSIGYRTNRMDKDKAKQAVSFLYKTILGKKMPEVVFTDSPLAALKKTSLTNSYFSFSNMECSYYVYYLYILEVIFPEKKKDFSLLYEVINALRELHCCYMFEDVCIVSDFPTVIHVNSDNRLHRDLGPAIEYADGYKLFSLNGIRVPEEIAMLDDTKITKDHIIKQKNVDIRREIVRKLSSEQLLNVLGAEIVDKFDNYELVVIDIGDKRKRPFLKMTNPSLNITHVEGVSPNVRTVKDAIKYRNGLSEYSAPVSLS